MKRTCRLVGVGPAPGRVQGSPFPGNPKQVLSAKKRTMRPRCVTPQRSSAGGSCPCGLTSPNDPNWKNGLMQTLGTRTTGAKQDNRAIKKKMTGRAGGALERDRRGVQKWSWKKSPEKGAWSDSASDVYGHPPPASRRRSLRDSSLPPPACPAAPLVPHRVVELGDGRHDGVVVLAPIQLRTASPQLVPPVRGAHGRSGASEQLLRSGDQPERLRGTLCVCGFMLCEAASGYGASPRASQAGLCWPATARADPPGPAPGSPGARRPRLPGAGPDWPDPER